MAARANRWGILEMKQGNAHFLDLVAPEVAWQVTRWRREAPRQWGPSKLALDVDRLRAALHRADRLKVDPYLVAYVILGAEWLFRRDLLTQEDIDSFLDVLEGKLRKSVIGDPWPWGASLFVGGIHRGVTLGLRGKPYMLSLGRGALPIRNWRDLVMGQERGRKVKVLPDTAAKGKSGRLTALSPIIVGLLLDGFAERAGQAGAGARAFAIEVASILRGRKIQPTEFGIWRQHAAGPAPDAHTGDLDSPPDDLRGWLVRRWESAYRICFEEPRRYWSTFLIEMANGPFAVFGPLADVDVVSLLYGITWSRSPSPPRRHPQLARSITDPVPRVNGRS